MSLPRALFGFAAATLAGCQSSVTLDLATSGALQAQGVELAVQSVHLLNADGNLESLDSQDPAAHDFMGYQDGSALRLLSGANTAEGHYAGLAVSFNPDLANVTTSDGTPVPVQVPSAVTFAAADFDLSRNEDRNLLAIMDLRFSLSDQTSSTGRYALQPHLYIVDRDAAGSVSGSISKDIMLSSNCLQGRSTPAGAGVYAFSGTGVTPSDEYPGVQPDPLTMAAVQWDAATSTATFAFPELNPGDYTLALSCEGYLDDPQAYQGLRFLATTNATVSTGLNTVVEMP